MQSPPSPTDLQPTACQAGSVVIIIIIVIVVTVDPSFPGKFAHGFHPAQRSWVSGSGVCHVLS